MLIETLLGDKRRGLFLLLVLLLMGAGACGRSPSPPPQTATQPSSASPASTPTPTPASLIGRDLLADPSAFACDQGEGAQFSCEPGAETFRLAVAIHAGTFARLRLAWPQSSEPLAPSDVLTLRFRLDGDLTPTLYFVEEGESEEERRRIRVDLAQAGLAPGTNHLHIPLRGIEDEDGRALRPEAIREIQIVFEWADMSGEMHLEATSFASTWIEEAPIPAVPDAVTVPEGFVIEAVAGGSHMPTQIAVPSGEELFVSQQDGRIWRYRDEDGDGRYEMRQLYASGFTIVTGLLYDPVGGAIWIGDRGRIVRTADTDGDGVADVREVRVDGLPWGRHQNNGMAWNPVADPFTAEPAYTWIYFGLGSVEDLEVGEALSATVLRLHRDGAGVDDLEVVSRGNRNAYDVLWAPVSVPEEPDAVHWALFASENGPDFNNAPDEVNHIRWQHHYGFPEQFGAVAEDEEGDPYTGPVYEVTPHASADGLAYVTNPAWPAEYRTLYVSLFGEVFSPERVGHTVDRVVLQPVETASGRTYRGAPAPFITGLERPLPLTTDADGNLLVADYADGTIYRVRYVGNAK